MELKNNSLKKQKRKETESAIIAAVTEMTSPPKETVSIEELMEYEPELQVLFENLLFCATKSVYTIGKGNKDLLTSAVDKIINFRRKKFKTNSLLVDFFNITEEGREAFETMRKSFMEKQ